ncbi:MAG: hypothetical protein PGN09_00465 [Sphingomonas fennica]
MPDGDRAATLIALDGADRTVARAQNFLVELARRPAGATLAFASTQEVILLLPDGGGTVESEVGATPIAARGVVIVPPGRHCFRFGEAGRLVILATDRTDPDGQVIANAKAYAEPDPRVAPIGKPFERCVRKDEVIPLPIADIPFPAGNPRLKFVQSATMSINWVEYAAPRDRTALSPHAHDDLEQGSLAIDGHFVHHLRTPWGRNADLWREDEHRPAAPATLLVIPPDIVHTTEGVGEGHHLLIDIFAPPRRDFIARDWVFNAGDYRDPQIA